MAVHRQVQHKEWLPFQGIFLPCLKVLNGLLNRLQSVRGPLILRIFFQLSCIIFPVLAEGKVNRCIKIEIFHLISPENYFESLSICFSSSAVKLVFSMHFMQSVIWLGLLAPIRTLVIASSFRIQLKAI